MHKYPLKVFVHTFNACAPMLSTPTLALACTHGVCLSCMLQVEARLARREEARAREDSPDTLPVTGGGNIMGGDDSFEAAKARQVIQHGRVWCVCCSVAWLLGIGGVLPGAADVAHYHALQQGSGRFATGSKS